MDQTTISPTRRMPFTALPDRYRICPSPANGDQMACYHDWLLMDQMQREGKFNGGSCCYGGGNKYGSPPWITMPPEGRAFQFRQSAPINSFTVGVNTVVTTFRVPTGYDGVITGLVNLYTGLGFTEGSGQLIWRIRVQPRWVKYFSVINNTLGSFDSPSSLYRSGVRIKAQQTVDYVVNVVNAAGLDPLARIECGFYGWFYPQS